MPNVISNRGRPPYPDLLTLKEWQVLAFLRQELSNAEIAKQMGVSVNTVKTHVSNVLGKLGLNRRA